MKKSVIISAVLVFTILNCTAQPNGGFENWSAEFSYIIPDGWATLNAFSLLSPPNPLSAFKASGIDKHSGTYALKLKTVFINNNPVPGMIADTFGGVFSGKIILSPVSFIYGFQYSERPEKLEFWAKYNPVGADLAEAAIILRRWNGSGRDTIANGWMSFGATTSYSLFEIPFTYYSTSTPDSALIAFSSSNSVSAQARVGSILFVDDVSFTGWVGIDDQTKFADKVKIFPNPAKDNVTIQAQINDASAVKVSDVSGKQVGVFKIQDYNSIINTSLFAEGIYFYEVLDKKDKILTTGKFDIIR